MHTPIHRIVEAEAYIGNIFTRRNYSDGQRAIMLIGSVRGILQFKELKMINITNNLPSQSGTTDVGNYLGITLEEDTRIKCSVPNAKICINTLNNEVVIVEGKGLQWHIVHDLHTTYWVNSSGWVPGAHR